MPNASFLRMEMLGASRPTGLGGSALVSIWNSSLAGVQMMGTFDDFAAQSASPE
jgi:hypothetical protein